MTLNNKIQQLYTISIYLSVNILSYVSIYSGLIRVGTADYLMTAGAALNLSIYSGLIGVGTADYLMTAGAALNAFHVPVVTVDPNFYLKVRFLLLDFNLPRE